MGEGRLTRITGGVIEHEDDLAALSRKKRERRLGRVAARPVDSQAAAVRVPALEEDVGVGVEPLDVVGLVEARLPVSASHLRPPPSTTSPG